MNNIIAKLLARENIEVIEGNFHTASFDILNRVLRIPVWGLDSKDVYDLFIGHEVGHALYTKVEGIHEAKEIIPGVPFSYVNVVEDCRIEKLIRRDFPGLVPAFKRAYDKLIADEFFGENIAERINTLSLIDRINVKAKCGHSIDVIFNAEEQALFDMCMSSETWDDVVKAIQAIIEYEKNNKPQENPTQEKNQPKNTESLEEESNESESSDDEPEQSDDESKESDNEPEQSDLDNIEESQTEIDETTGPLGSSDTSSELPESITDNTFRQKEQELIKESLSQNVYVNITKEDQDYCITDYKTLALNRQEFYNHVDFTELKGYYNSYISGVKKTIAQAVNNFNMSKSAHRYSRSKVSKTGSLDTSKLWSHKISDEIFKSVTILGDSKNHGLFILLDMSGSMSELFSSVLDQMMHIITFAKATDIPFELYTFTSGNARYSAEEYSTMPAGTYIPESSIVHMCSSNLNKKDFQESMLHLYRLYITYNQSRYSYSTASNELRNIMYACNIKHGLHKLEQMAGTPLADSIIMLHSVMTDFARKVEKPIFVNMIDGDTQRLNICTTNRKEMTANKVIFLNNKKFNMQCNMSTQSALTRRAVVNKFVKSLGYQTVCIYMTQSPSINAMASIINEISNLDKKGYFHDITKFNKKALKADGCAVYDNCFGYDCFYVTCPNQLEALGDTPVEGDSIAKVRKSFIASTTNKKKKNYMITHFGKYIA